MLKAVDLTALKTSSPDKALSDLSDSNFYDDVMTMVMLSASYGSGHEGAAVLLPGFAISW